ncbi:MAG: ABC transporter ATP-binding protein [Desulfuromonadales bacterium]|nr:ABC transporter ATP-binding protein [Desulfuromonadales bacterium]
MSTVIKVENLSKRYYLSHQQRERFPTLRDAISRKTSEFGRRLLHPLRASSGQPLAGAENTEEFWALQDVSFEVKQGDRIGIIGRNGAGKSTLLKILSRITEPTSGKVSIKGRVASLLEVGTGFHPELTGRENIFLNGAILGMSKTEIRRKFDEIVDFAEVEKFLDTPVKRYSSGMYVRLAFAVAAHLEPEILIIDEVLAVGDFQFQRKCLGKMDEVGSQGRTVLFVSHNMAAIEYLCSKCLMLENGQVVSRGPVNEVVGTYLEKSVLNAQKSGMCQIEATYIKEIRVSGGGDLKGTFFMGEHFRAEIDVEGLSNLSGTQVSLSFVTAFGMRVFTLNTGMTCDYLDTERHQSETYILNIPSLQLVSGLYFIEISIAQKGIRRLEHFENVMSVEVVGKDVYGRGYKLNDHYGVVYVDGNWEVKNSQREQ